MKQASPGLVIGIFMLIASAYGGPIQLPSHLLPKESLLANSTELLSQLGEDFFSHGALWKLSIDVHAPNGASPPDLICTEEGLFPVKDSCSDYYYCQDLSPHGIEDWYMFWFTCPNGTIYDANNKTCNNLDISRVKAGCHQTYEEDFFDNVSVPESADFRTEDGNGTNYQNLLQISQDLIPMTVFSSQENDEVSNDKLYSQMRKKRSSDLSKMVDIAADSAKEACNDLKVVNNYVRYVNSKRTLPIQGFNTGYYANIISQYNEILLKAKNNSRGWRSKNGILEVITETFFLTKMFEPKFQERFHGIEKKVSAVSKQDKIEIERLEREVTELRDSIRETEEVLPVVVSEQVKLSMESMLEDKRDNLDRLLEEYEKTKTDAEFDELMVIMESVRKDAIQIQGKAVDAKAKMQTFHYKIMQDKSGFERSRYSSEAGIQSATRTVEENKRQLLENGAARNILQAQIRNEETKIYSLKQNLAEARIVLENRGASLRRQIKSAEDRIIAGSVLLVIPVFGWIAGGTLLGTGIKDKKDALHQMERAVQSYSNSLSSAENYYRYLLSQIEVANNQINNLKATNRDLQQKLNELPVVSGNLQNLKNDLESTLLVISKAITGLESVKTLFEETEIYLMELTEEAKQAYIEAQRKEASYFRYQVVHEKLKNQWENGAEKIISVGDCINYA